MLFVKGKPANGCVVNAMTFLRFLLRNSVFTRRLTRSLVRPGNEEAICAQEEPWIVCSFSNNLSSSSVQLLVLREGSRKFCHRSRHCFGLRVKQNASEILFQRPSVPNLATSKRSFASSWLCHLPFTTHASSGRKAFRQRCAHLVASRVTTMSAISFQFDTPYCFTASSRRLSSSLPHRLCGRGRGVQYCCR